MDACQIWVHPVPFGCVAVVSGGGGYLVGWHSVVAVHGSRGLLLAGCSSEFLMCAMNKDKNKKN